MAVEILTTNTMTRPEAEMLTAKIKGHIAQAWTLLREAHERRAWIALSYTSFGEYVSAEFAVSRQHAYRMLDAAKVVHEIEEAAGVSPVGDITEREARDLKPMLGAVTEAIRVKVADPGEVDRVAIVRAVIEQHRVPTGDPAVKPVAIEQKILARLFHQLDAVDALLVVAVHVGAVDRMDRVDRDLLRLTLAGCGRTIDRVLDHLSGRDDAAPCEGGVTITDPIRLHDEHGTNAHGN